MTEASAPAPPHYAPPNRPQPDIIGRFAPSPTGPLHLGSLFAALASFLDARSRQGQWRLRIDDLDAPRNQPGAAAGILGCLEKFGLQWDGEVYYQSRHLEAYAAAIEQLRQRQAVYACDCSRKRLSAHPGVYPGICRQRQHPFTADRAIRVITPDQTLAFNDACQGQIAENLAQQHGDFIIKRRDGFYAYQLAVVIDDHAQHITRVTRGVDLLDSTPKQIHLQGLLGLPTPQYRHIPVIIAANGDKLSKQTLAPAVDPTQAAATLHRLLILLRQNPPPELRQADVAEILAWAIAHWQPELLNGLRTIPDPTGK